MGKIISFTIFCIIFVTLVANPAPVSIEVEDLILIALPFFLGLLALASMKSYRLYLPERNLLIAICLYLSYLLISIFISLVHGVPLLNALRSLGPYINFFPLIFIGLLPTRLYSPWILAMTLIAVGAMQAGYQVYLYLQHSMGHAGVMDVLRSRITLVESRTTLPIVLSTTILPLVLLAYPQKKTKLLALSLILFGLFAGVATLTRSIVIAIVAGWLTFSVLYFYQASRSPAFSLANASKYFVIYLIMMIGMLLILSLIPSVHLLEQAIWSRFSYHAASGADYSNGRLYDEWLPALQTWSHSGVISILFGMGAGSTFTVASGEERTYIHNLIIYSLVYGGIYGLFCCLWLYFTVFKTLVLRAIQAQQTIYLGFAALLASIFTYAQLFAVHKGLAFNAMLFCIITLALSQPLQDINTEKLADVRN